MTAQHVSSATQFMEGMRLPFQSFRFLLRHRTLWPYALLPLIINIVLITGIVVALIFWAFPYLNPAEMVPAWMGETIHAGVEYMAYFFGILLSLLIGYVSFSTIGLIVASPFNDMLSEKTEILLIGQGDPNMPWKTWMAETMRTLAGSIGLLCLQWGITLCLLPFLLIPVLGAGLLFGVNGYFTGREFLDIPMARHYFRKAHRRAGLCGVRWRVTGFGVGMLLLMLIPGCVLIMLPVGVVGGTLLYVEIPWRAHFDAKALSYPHGFTSEPSSAATTIL